MDKFYPIILATTPPTILTREEVETYFALRGTTVHIHHLPATNPQNEDGH